MPRFVRNLWARIRCRRLNRRGRRALSRGDVREAVRCFEGALRERPHAFWPLLHLSRAYLRSRDHTRAHRMLARAREADPVRFLEQAPRWLAREGYLVEEVTQSRAATRRPEPAAARASRRAGSSVLRFGDCRDLDEYARFQAMPPISTAEVEALDWDSVISDLFDD